MMSWTSDKLLNWSVECLTKAGVNSPRLEAEILLAKAIRSRRLDVYLEPDRVVNLQELCEQQNFVRRRMAREPISYIIGSREFWSLEFNVSSEVLVPRPETEVLLEQLVAVHNDRKNKGPVQILDIGTGSGIIAIVAAKEIPDCQVTAVDLSPPALAIATENSRIHNVAEQIQFVHSNLFENVTGQFDYILSNPPYSPLRELEMLMPDVRDYEPRTALNGGQDGLDFYKRIIPAAWDHLKDNGVLIMEIGMDQAMDIRYIIETFGKYEEPRIIRDYSGRDRVLVTHKGNNG
jgi:release factor glutamine methyltransferase